MLEFSRIKKHLPLIVVLFAICTLAGFFFLRPPVLIVTDLSFAQLYGPLRFRLKELRTSIELFRRVKLVQVAESAGPDLVTLAAEASSRSPAAVLFPNRYLEGARYYKDRFPQAPVLVMGTDPTLASETALTIVRTDTVQDLFRAGVCAAALAAGKRVIFFSAEALAMQYREAFREGCRTGALALQPEAGGDTQAQGSTNDPVFLLASADYSSYPEVGCVVIAGQAAKFLEQRHTIPVILFSWADPAQTPLTVKVIFDDSPLALAKEVLRSFPPPGGEILVPSVPVFLEDRIAGKEDFRKIRSIIKEKFEKN